jgi:hypothetical protein
MAISFTFSGGRSQSTRREPPTVPVHTTTHCRFYREQQWTQHLLRPALHQDVFFFFWFLTDFNEVQKESTRKSSMNAIVLDIFERKMDECVHRTWMFPLPSKVNRGITPEHQKW